MKTIVVLIIDKSKIENFLPASPGLPVYPAKGRQGDRTMSKRLGPAATLFDLCEAGEVPGVV